jgi:hypothetical protein
MESIMLNERNYGGEFLISDANRTRSRELIVVAASQTLGAGRVLGRVLVGALSAVAAAVAGNTGNGAMGAVTVDAGADTGAYKLVFIEPGTNLGDFVVERPDGVVDGHGKVGTAYNGRINFTLADGATDFVAGDAFDITVSAAAAAAQGQYKGLDPVATDGSQTVAGILWDAVTTGVGVTAKAAAVVRDAEVDLKLLDFGTLDAGQKTTAIAQLAALGIICR